MRRKIQGREIKVEEHEKVVLDVFVRLVLVQSAITPHVYKERMDFPWKERAWIHVHNPNLCQSRMADANLPKLFGLKTDCTLRVVFEVVNDL